MGRGAQVATAQVERDRAGYAMTDAQKESEERLKKIEAMAVRSLPRVSRPRAS